MFNHSSEFLTSAPTIRECPPVSLPEVCFAGRSNVGKSSVINAILNRKNLARTSNVPGKTQQMNYYRVGDLCYFVDLPGYGFARVPQKERDRWGRDIKEYLLNRESLSLILHIVDIRHEPSKLDKEFFYWMGVNQKPFSVILSKSDKISKNQREKSKALVKRVLAEFNIEVPIIYSSAESREGIEEVQELITEFVES